MSSGSSHPGGSKQVYKVKIFNQLYSIASSATEAEFQQIADQVDLLMQTIASRAGTADGARVGVMAAMHLADKLRQAERRLESLSSESESIRSRIDERALQLDRILQEALEDEPEFLEEASLAPPREGPAEAVVDAPRRKAAEPIRRKAVPERDDTPATPPLFSFTEPDSNGSDHGA